MGCCSLWVVVKPVETWGSALFFVMELVMDGFYFVNRQLGGQDKILS